MKRYYSIRLVVLGTVLLLLSTACQRFELLESNDLLEGKLLFFASLGEAQTATRVGESDNDVLKKASVFGNTTPHIVVKAYTGTPGSALSEYFSDELGYSASGKWEVVSGEDRVLPKGSMNLYAYFGTGHNGEAALPNVVYLPPTSPNEYPKVTFTAVETDALHQIDLIAAKTENIGHPNVYIPFRHTLSQINFGVKGIDRHCITVKSIRINNVYGKGTFDYLTFFWRPDNTVGHSYPYYFPDRTTTESGGSGDNYQTMGKGDDSKYTYLFGDGGKFGVGNDNTFLYAQVDPSATNYATQANTPAPLQNSLMLLPQQITANPNATVTFDYEIKVNGSTIRSGANVQVRLDHYNDWKPNLRYVYIFNFDDPSEHITFDVLLSPWEGWDGKNGLKNGTIQEPSASTLNTIGDGEILYLNGLLTNSLIWNWSNFTTYSFNQVNYLYLDFAGVEMDTCKVEVKVPVGFTVTPAFATKSAPRITIEKTSKQFFTPTDKQISSWGNNTSFRLNGTLSEEIIWNWTQKNFTSLEEGMKCTLNFSAVNFNGHSVNLTLPSGFTASPSSVINSSTPSIVIENKNIKAIQMPASVVLNAATEGNEVIVNGGGVLNEITWDWRNINFGGLTNQEKFTLKFQNVVFGGNRIILKLPVGFSASGVDVAHLSDYIISGNSEVIVKNNKINYPSVATLNGVYNNSTIIIAGEKLSTDPLLLDWTIPDINFQGLFGQNSFALDLTGVENIQFSPITIKFPTLFECSGGTPSGDNQYTFSTASSITIKNNAMRTPSNLQINAMRNGQSYQITGGKLLEDCDWDWSLLQMNALGGVGNSFNIGISGVSFNGQKIVLKLPSGITASGINVTHQSNNTYLIAGNTTITLTDAAVRIDNNSPTAAYFDLHLSANKTMTFVGKMDAGGLDHLWDWSLFENTPNIGVGQLFTLDFSRVDFINGHNIYFKIPGDYQFNISGIGALPWGYVIHSGSNKSITFEKRFNALDVSIGQPDLTAVTAGQTVYLRGSLLAVLQWNWFKLPKLAQGQWFEINYQLTGISGSAYPFFGLSGAPYDVSGDCEYSWAITIYGSKGTRIVRFTRNTTAWP